MSTYHTTVALANNQAAGYLSISSSRGSNSELGVISEARFTLSPHTLETSHFWSTHKAQVSYDPHTKTKVSSAVTKKQS